VPDTVWRLNDNFVILGMEGVLNMLNDEGCRELTWLLPMMPSSWRMFLMMCIGWQGKLCKSGGNHMVCLRLFTGLRQPARATVSDCGNWQFLFGIMH
jgi:hypothetical protein